ncbi:toll/interleukin-1 receptor domain-containing protein [Rhabdochromatium marinum]|uniref:toll/interleukin-1 receptor domain-containing protein n=1 Tax=Rhabdochromatium marinum TaxID=48729 RepID=UPI0019048312|nr:toll/interleukin-1 receptor domain-containing protein [Rhabdochromatium marinum]MBK1649582.1 hypothetical protein [Rhabdochromatium marinum]
MAPLKLFISHSSRLDDVPHKYTDDDANWRLLRKTCDGLKERYGDAIHILVDRDGLIPGDDWNRELNLWLAECQAAIILVSKRALEKSDWVAKEAAILGWRKVLNPNFILIPVTIEGESCQADLAVGFWGSLEMSRIQCVSARHDAQTIVEGVVDSLGNPADLSHSCACTPLDLLRDAVAKLLVDAATATALETALDDFGPLTTHAVGPGLPSLNRYAHRLAERLLQTSGDDVRSCFNAFRHILDRVPLLSGSQQRLLLKQLRALWVHPGAAGFLPAAGEDKRPLALCGQMVTLADDLLKAEAYTLERYLERAWPGSHPRCVPITELQSAEQVRAEIRRRVLGPGVPSSLPDALLDVQVNQEPTAIVVIIPATESVGGLPDPLLRRDLEQLTRIYHKLVLVFASCLPAHDMPDGLRPITPPLEANTEMSAYLAERAAVTILDQD